MSWLGQSAPEPVKTPTPLSAAKQAVDQALGTVSSISQGAITVKDHFYGNRNEQIDLTDDEKKLLLNLQEQLAWLYHGIESWE